MQHRRDSPRCVIMGHDVESHGRPASHLRVHLRLVRPHRQAPPHAASHTVRSQRQGLHGAAAEVLQAAHTAGRYASLHLDASKTDPFSAEVNIIIAAPTALSALCTYGSLCSATGLLASTPLFHFADGQPVTRRWLMGRVDSLLRSTHHDPRAYSGHSFRKGGTVSLQQQGVEDSTIRRTGRWRSDAFYLYVRHASMDALVAANALVSRQTRGWQALVRGLLERHLRIRAQAFAYRFFTRGSPCPLSHTSAWSGY